MRFSSVQLAYNIVVDIVMAPLFVPELLFFEGHILLQEISVDKLTHIIDVITGFMMQKYVGTLSMYPLTPVCVE